MSSPEAWGARSAIIGGVLRIAASFVPYTAESIALETFYAIIDVFLLFGLFAMFSRLASRPQHLATAGLVIAIIGQASIIGPDTEMFGVDFYLAGTTVLLVGLGLTSAAMMRAGAMRSAALYWLGCIVLALAAAIVGSSILAAAAGIVFGMGFIVAGRALLRTAKSTTIASTTGRIE